MGKAATYLDPLGNSRRTDLETVPFKPRADCIFLGSAWSPGGHPAEMIDVAFGGDFRPITTHSASAVLNKAMGAHALKGGVPSHVPGKTR